MTCTDFLSQLTDYFDGQISAELLEEVRAHTAECSHCEVVLNTTRQTIEVYRGSEVFEIPTDLQERLHAAIMAKCKGSKRGCH
jgi:anti-sigma factor RsiW